MSKRRSARIAFEEEETANGDARSAKAAKKTKTLDAALDQQIAVNGKTVKKPAKSAGRQAAYDEDADGFTFSRSKKPKKTTASVVIDVPDTSGKKKEGEAKTSTTETAPARASRTSEGTANGSRRGRRKKYSLEVANTAVPETQPTRRRSARLSGDKVESGQQQQQHEKSTQPARHTKNQKTAPRIAEKPTPRSSPPSSPKDSMPRGRELERVARTPQHRGDLHINKKRKGETTVDGTIKIALPFADTPVMARNKEMRKTSADSARRSSSAMRGRRASDLFDRGNSNDHASPPMDKAPAREQRSNELQPDSAVPHHEVEATEFYKHISQELPEPRRMKQLLTWCATRALPPKPTTGTSEEIHNALAARVIQEELLKDFSNKSEMSDWFVREDNAPVSLLKKPNPRNEQNARKLIELQHEVKRLEAERATWDRVLNKLNESTEAGRSLVKAEEEKAMQEEKSLSSSSLLEALDAQALDDEEQISILQSLKSHDDIVASSRARVRAAIQPLEFKIDLFADNVHKLSQIKEEVDETSSIILREAAVALEERHQAGVERIGMEKVGVGDVLRTLSRLPPSATSSSSSATTTTTTKAATATAAAASAAR